MQERLVKRLACTDSTNSVAWALAREGAPAGTVVVAEAQTQGRGRLARAWVSPPAAGLYFSMILRPTLAVKDLAKIPLAAAVAVCQAVEAHCALQPAIKWPNDLLWGGRKFGGILTETGPIRTGANLVVLGIGLNVTTPPTAFPAALQDRATSLLLATGQAFGKEALLSAVLARLDLVMARLAGADFAALLNEWRRRDALQGATLSWLTPGGEVVSGVALGLDDEGGYRIRDRAGVIHEVLSGDLALRL